MNRAKTQMPKRPRLASSATARSPKEAAINLVRLEFDAARLEMGIEQASNRVESYRAELDLNRAERAKLLQIINR